MQSLKIQEQLSFLRRQKGVTQEELAQALGVTNQSVSKWESGQCCPDIQLLPELAAYFGVTVDELLGCAAPEIFRNVYLGIKDLFKASPAEESFSLAFKLATLLHEGAVSGGYKKHLPWDSDKQYGLDTEPYKWGWSICSEPEGSSAHIGNGIFMTDQKYWQPAKTSEIAAVYATLDMFCDINVLKALYALFELTVSDFDNLYVTAADVAKKARMSEEAAQAAINRLPVQTSGDDGESKYRLEGKYMHLPPLLLMLAMK